MSDSITYIQRNNVENYEKTDSLERAVLSFETDVDTSNIYLSLEKLEHYSQTSVESGYLGIKHTISLGQVDGVFALLLVCFLLLTRIYKGGLLFFKENSRLVFSSREDIGLFSETTVSEFWYNFALFFQTALLTAIIAFFFCLDVEKASVPQDSFLTIVSFLVLICLTEGLKYIYYKLIGFVFNIQNVIHIWLRSYVLIIEMMGIIAFIPVLLLVYSNYFHDILTYFFIILFILSRLIIFYRIIIFFSRENVNLLYLIAYLCSVEIFPYFFLYKALTHLYKIDIISLLWH